MFGWSRNEAIGQRLEDLIIPLQFRNAHRQGLQHFLHTGIGPLLNQLIEHVAMRKDGSEFPVELSIAPLKLGNAYIFSGFIHEITARKASEQKIRQAESIWQLPRVKSRLPNEFNLPCHPQLRSERIILKLPAFAYPPIRLAVTILIIFFAIKTNWI